jgi:hypothetical protein
MEFTGQRIELANGSFTTAERTDEKERSISTTELHSLRDFIVKTDEPFLVVTQYDLHTLTAGGCLPVRVALAAFMAVKCDWIKVA